MLMELEADMEYGVLKQSHGFMRMTIIRMSPIQMAP